MQRSPKMKLMVGVALMAFSTSSSASNIILSDGSGGVNIAGELMSFDGKTYMLRTVVGDLQVDSAFVTCAGDACPVIESPLSEFRISGSNTLGKNLIPSLLNGYGSTQLNAETQIIESSGSQSVTNFEMTSNAGDVVASVDIKASNSTDGLSELLARDTTIALASRPARNRETRSFLDAGFGDIRSADSEHIVALDGLLLITSPDNPVRAITELNAALVFAGQITNWSELGGPDAPINLYVRDGNSGTREMFENLVMRSAGLEITDDVLLISDDATLSRALIDDPFGLGFTNFADGEGAKALSIEGVCGLQTPPNAFTVKTEEYPLTRLLYMYSDNAALPEHAKGLLDYAMSEQAQSIVRDAGFIDQSIRSASIDSQGLRVASAVVANRDSTTFPQLQGMIGELLTSDRLSTTFRFETGSSDLDARAQDDIQRLARLLKTDAYTNKEALFVGFTDSVGDPDLNKELSNRRAQQVVQQLLREEPDLQSRVQLKTVGYGEISPLGCNETNVGRRINRRVEVWIRDVVADDQSATLLD